MTTFPFPRYRARSLQGENGEQKASSKPLHRSASLDGVGHLSKPFRCPSSATASRNSNKPARKRRKVNYAEADGTTDHQNEQAWVDSDRQPLSERDANKFPVFKVKDKETTFKQRFRIPLANKTLAGGYDASRPAPTLGTRQGAVFVVKPLHDPSGEFSIVLYDPTVDGVDNKPEQKEKEEGKEEENDKPKLDGPLVHKSLADILGLKKKVEAHPKVPVVIDPRLAKVLRPHQVEGVKVNISLLYCVMGIPH